MAYECFDVSTDEDGIAHIVLNRPDKRNAMSPAFWDDLPKIIDELDGSGKVKVIVISSTGPHFTAGLDLSMFGASAKEELSDEEKEHRKTTAGVAFYQNVMRLQDAFTALENARVPVLAAIQGGCIGGGVDMTTACDMRYCTQDAFFTIYEINVGMTADVGTFPRITNLLPEGIVRELAYTGRRMLADEAKTLGLVNQVYQNQEEMLEGVMAIARDIASKPPMAIYGCKRIIKHSRDHKTEETLDYIGIWNASMLKQSEVVEAIASRQAKRDANFAPLPPVRKNAAIS